MARNAGFAFVSCMSEGLVNSVLRAVHANFLPPFQFALPSPLNAGGMSVNALGSLIFLPPQVTLQSRPDNLVTVSVGFAGQVNLTAGAQSVQTEALLSATVLVGLISNVTTVGANQQVTVGLNLAQASVSAVQVSVINGPALSALFTSALSSGPVLTALTLALRAVPPNLVQITASGLKLPINAVQTYQPPGGSLFDPDVLFQTTFSVGRIVARPIDAALAAPGVLAVGVDMVQPQSTNGIPGALVDLNTVPAPHGNIVAFDGYGGSSFGGGTVSSHTTNAAIAVNGDWLSAVVNSVISPQLRGKFYADLADNKVAFQDTPDCLQLSFGAFQVPLNSPPPIPTDVWINGFSLQVRLTRFMNVIRDARSYYHGVAGLPGNVDVVFQALNTVILSTFGGPFPGLPNPASGVPRVLVSFSTNPDGGYLYIDGVPIVLGIGPYNYKSNELTLTKHSISADPLTFSSWSTSGAVVVDKTTNNPATLTVNGAGSVSLRQSSFDPLINLDHWSAAVVGTDISLPWWVDFHAIMNAPVYIVASSMASFFGADIWYPTIIENADLKAQGGVESAISGALPDFILFNKGMTVTQLPGTAAPDWLVTASDFSFSSEGAEGYVRTNLLPPGLVTGSRGNFPYLMVTDQDVSDPSTVPDIPDPYGGFPSRIDGSFNWPGISWNQSPSVGGVAWDVHDLNPINVVLKIPPGLFNPQDPSVLVQWIVTRPDTGEVIISKTLGIGQGGAPVNILTVSIDHASGVLQAADGFQVSCNLFRPLPGGNDQIFSSSLRIGIEDHFDRHHPYVRWGPHVKHIYPGVPFWNAIPPKAHEVGVGWGRDVRESRIHRTDFWSGGRRCLVADISGSMGKRPKKPRGAYNYNKAPQARTLNYPWTYLDRLPVSLDEVRQNRELARGILCDYCFFGGPTKTQLRSDLP